jgi:hypothetical protein
MKRRIITYLLSFVVTAIAAQVKVESSISAVEMLVGQQVQLTVSATTDENDTVEFPKEAYFPQGVEFLGAIEIPDEVVEGGQVKHQRGYVLTSFEDTLYYIRPMVIKVNDQEYKTNQLALKV